MTLPSGGPSAASSTPETSTEAPAVSRAYGSSVSHQVAPDASTSETIVGTLRTASGGPSNPSAAKDSDRIVYRGTEMEVRSAGPDRVMWTTDDRELK